ncbi:hypothetical protein LNM24_002503 [Enterococcus faecalis]|nr:hypothetical protein [Enterococcus faecalis]HAP3820628.1 hypothetical protein [Enterococcus faecalis]
MYYLYFKENDFQKVNDNQLQRIKKLINESSGSQILTIGMTEKQTNATEFIVWGKSKEEVEEHFNSGIKDVFENLMSYMEGDLKKGLELTKLRIEKGSYRILGELYL